MVRGYSAERHQNPDSQDPEPTHETVLVMKVRASVKPICPKCKIIKRKGVVRIICDNPRHKQRQG